MAASTLEASRFGSRRDCTSWVNRLERRMLESPADGGEWRVEVQSLEGPISPQRTHTSIVSNLEDALDYLMQTYAALHGFRVASWLVTAGECGDPNSLTCRSSVRRGFVDGGSLGFHPHRGGGMSHRILTPEFKDEVVRQVVERGYTLKEVAARLWISEASSYNRRKAVVRSRTRNRRRSSSRRSGGA